LKVPKDLPALLERVFEAFAWEGIVGMLENPVCEANPYTFD
jgi:hypothetical protein